MGAPTCRQRRRYLVYELVMAWLILQRCAKDAISHAFSFWFITVILGISVAAKI
jgi:hypothetical protein